MTDFSSLYEKYAADVFRFALYLSGNRGDAEDITSETFVRAWAAQDYIRAETAKGYLFTIARNLFLKGIRNTSRHTGLHDNVPDFMPSAFDLVAQKAEVRAVLIAMQRLPAIDSMNSLTGRSHECWISRRIPRRSRYTERGRR
jgi:RNA polymerase sigma factor (sigma-70 family)